ncbi:hypothetical protein WR25_07252 [Diploscapter pachys]|uniref:Uncharacterized protein n=1 Tax=Diploscapter pachys TaxID=2018661 RepID=A0A2A2L808_9BILA|nr:hypothetical protein WR25_07252 [Diploscapter pachys]
MQQWIAQKGTTTTTNFIILEWNKAKWNGRDKRSARAELKPGLLSASLPLLRTSRIGLLPQSVSRRPGDVCCVCRGQPNHQQMALWKKWKAVGRLSGKAGLRVHQSEMAVGCVEMEIRNEWRRREREREEVRNMPKLSGLYKRVKLDFAKGNDQSLRFALNVQVSIHLSNCTARRMEKIHLGYVRNTRRDVLEKKEIQRYTAQTDKTEADKGRDNYINISCIAVLLH